MADIDKLISLVPGKPKMNLHASYAIFDKGEWVDRDKLEPKHFAKWVKFCKERLSHYKVPRSIEFVDSLPISATGKILRRVLRQKEREKN